MFGYRTFYFIGLLALLVSDRILGTEHTISLPVCLFGLTSLLFLPYSLIDNITLLFPPSIFLYLS